MEKGGEEERTCKIRFLQRRAGKLGQKEEEEGQGREVTGNNIR